MTAGGCAGANAQSETGGLRDITAPQDTGPEVQEEEEEQGPLSFLVGWEGEGKGTITLETVPKGAEGGGKEREATARPREWDPGVLLLSEGRAVSPHLPKAQPHQGCGEGCLGR